MAHTFESDLFDQTRGLDYFFRDHNGQRALEDFVDVVDSEFDDFLRRLVHQMRNCIDSGAHGHYQTHARETTTHATRNVGRRTGRVARRRFTVFFAQ